MSELQSPQVRRRRADAEHSVTAILDAAVQILNERPRASVEEIADAAGLTRQTVYSHYPSRRALVSAAIDRVSGQAVAEMEAVDIEHDPPTEALLRLINIGWRTYQSHPRLLRMAALEPNADEARHEPVRELLERVAKRGQDAGVFDGQLSPAWLAGVAMAIGHVAGEDVAAGRIRAADAITAIERSTLRVFGAVSTP